MKKLNLILGFLIGLLIFSCSSDSTLLAQGKYKGAPKHKKPSIEVIPYLTEYTIDQGLVNNLKSKLDQHIDDLFEQHNIAGITATILIPEKGIWQTNKGFISKPDNIVVDSSSVFYWASVGKLVTSTIVHQLIVEDKLSLEDKLYKWFPDIQYAKKITIQQLLNHTNGIYSFNSDPNFHYSDKDDSPIGLLEISKAKENLFKPGEYWSYTNTGYLLLALITEKIESKTFEQVVKERISDSLHLKTLEASKEIPSNLALAHNKDTIIPKDSSGPLGAGNVISNSKDIAVFLSALLSGKILPIEMVHDMLKNLYPMFNKGQYYGNGIMLYDFKEINSTDNMWIGHSGGTENYKTIALFDIKTKVIIAISINENIPVEAVALRLMELVNE
ncbi:serine hydrolase domain-containing protein [uncultured Maribacter sp.]|uniref:serine hydrolase domain-containing protein n=1 Tax=uncultured Maribacter sp. TaxID=431308 RepID=UPI002637582E|nr:serine hydrolase domain-containing protein [uncultured Maribacter sp.]